MVTLGVVSACGLAEVDTFVTSAESDEIAPTLAEDPIFEEPVPEPDTSTAPVDDPDPDTPLVPDDAMGDGAPEMRAEAFVGRIDALVDQAAQYAAKVA